MTQLKASWIALFLIVGFTGGSGALAQVTSPKPESRLHHLFVSHSDTDNLQQTFDDLKCSLVLIESGPRLGTGFYISADGDVATASHVLGDRKFSRNADATITASIAIPKVLVLTTARASEWKFQERP